MAWVLTCFSFLFFVLLISVVSRALRLFESAHQSKWVNTCELLCGWLLSLTWSFWALDAGNCYSISIFVFLRLSQLLCYNWVNFLLFCCIIGHLFVIFLLVEGCLGVINSLTLSSLCVICRDLFFVELYMSLLNLVFCILKNTRRLLSLSTRCTLTRISRICFDHFVPDFLKKKNIIQKPG